MTQQIINVGEVANDGTGESLRTAFEAVNNNFSQIWSSGPVNTNVVIANNVISTVPVNTPLILAPGGIGNVQSNAHILPGISGVYDLGSPTKKWDAIYGDYLYGNGYFLTGIQVANVGSLVNGNSNVVINGPNGVVTISVAGVPNVATISSTGVSVAGAVTASGNVSANYFVGNGSLLTGIVASGGASIDNGNSNVRISADAGNVTVGVSGVGNVAVFTPTGLQVANTLTAGVVSVSGNVVAVQFQGNGSGLTSITGANVTGNVPRATYAYTAAQAGIASLANRVTDNAQPNITSVGILNSLSVSGNITGSYIYGNGRYLTGVAAGGAVTFANLAPSLPNVGDVWIQANTGTQYIYFNDTTSNQWAEMEAYVSYGTTGGGGNTFSAITMTSTPSGASNQINYGTGNLVLYNDGGWALGVYDGTSFGTEGMRLSPGIEGNVEVILPADQNAATNSLQLNNYAGNVQVRANNNYWIFGKDGNLTLPGNTSTINYLNGDPYAVSKIANGNTYANIDFPSGNLAVGVNVQPVTGAWINTYGNIVVNDSYNSEGESVLIDGGGNVFVTGASFNPDFNQDQAFVRKLDPSGQVMWQKSLPQSADGTVYSSGETLAQDGSGNIYWLANLWDVSSTGRPMVAKLNSSTGESIWTTYITGVRYGYDMTVNSAGQVFVVTNADGRITSLNSDGTVAWSRDPSDNGTSIVDTGTYVIIGYSSGTVGAYDYSGNLLWTNQVFNTGQPVWGLAWDGTNWYAADENGYIMKISGADNSTILWQKHINRNGTGGNIFLTWIEYADGYIYAVGTGNVGGSGIITVKINASTGGLVWARNLKFGGAGQWYWYGHHDISVRGSYYAITGQGYPANVNNSKQVLAQLPTDGSLAGTTVGPYRYVDIPALTVDTVSVAGTGYNGSPSQPATVSVTPDYTLVTLVAPGPEVNILEPFVTGALWSFDSNGNLTVPGTINGITNNYVSLNAFNNGDNPQVMLINWDVANSTPSTIIGVNPNYISFSTNINGNTAYDWQFDNTGNLTLPGNTSSINYANGQPYGGSGGNYGDSNVTTLLSDFGSNNISTTGSVTAGQIDIGANLYIGPGPGGVSFVLANADVSLTTLSQGANGQSYFGWTANILAPGNLATMSFNTDGNAQGNAVITTGSDSTPYQWKFDNTGNLTLPGNTVISNQTGNLKINPVRSSTLNNYSKDTGNVLYYNTETHEVTTAPINNITGDPFAAYTPGTGNVTVWTASSADVVGAKLLVRVAYFDSGTSSWQNTEMLEIMAAKTWPNGTPVFTVSNRIKTNPAYNNVLIDVGLAAGNVMQVISSAPSGAGNSVYWTCSATSFNQTFD